MLAIQAGLPNHVELPEGSGRLQSPWRLRCVGQASYAGKPIKHSAEHQNCGNRRSKQKPNCQASSSASCRVIPGLSYIPLTHWPTSITRQFHPADRPGQRRAGDKRRFSTPTCTRTTWGQDSTVSPGAVLGSEGEIR
ncbi:hypothetical protein PCANC_01489 [Puccinia coronata f. sp. avenae]|uniref:Uncharacterized protein n=1 Tax=Puccinia coronata f. sp. avenae TaxID=200324 RepID=A0A2N5W2Y1_9BASI|nr:hypothetical protein PCANC_01489 [Puccinia coronata f. sp. avenae]